MPRFLVFAMIFACLLTSALMADDADPIKILFLGDNGHHRPSDRFRQLQPVLAKRGIELTYTEKTDSLDPNVLAGYDGLVIYANTTEISPAQEKALIDFVESGKGFIRAALRLLLFLELAQVHRAGRRPVPAARHGHGSHDDRRAAPSRDARLRGLRKLGRDLRPRQAQRRRSQRYWNIASRGT